MELDWVSIFRDKDLQTPQSHFGAREEKGKDSEEQRKVDSQCGPPGLPVCHFIPTGQASRQIDK